MKIIGIFLIGVVITLIIGFYNLYNGGDYALAQKTIGCAVVTLFFVIIPDFLIVRYKDKKLKSVYENKREQLMIYEPDA